MSKAAPGGVYRPRRRMLARDDAMVAVLSYYDSAVAQDLHVHDSAQVTFLLVGGLLERQRHGEYEPESGWVGFKPAGCLHANAFGGDGALLLTVELSANAAEPSFEGWSVHGDEEARTALTHLAIDTSGSAIAIEAIRDLLASAAHDDSSVPAPPPELEAARAQLHDEPEGCRIDLLAECAGLDRTHFARLFRRHFGTAPSLYRAKCMTAKATRALLTESPTIADAAFAGGFADHSHFTKTLRRFTGLSPQQLRGALA